MSRERPMDTEQIYARTTRNRLRLADMLQHLSPAQWHGATLCEGWAVQDLAAHLVQPMLVGFGRFFFTSVRYRGNTAATVNHLTRTMARRGPDELVALLREHAADRVNPPRVGPMGPFAETCIHGRDIARPAGLDVTVDQDDWVLLLDYLTSPGAAPTLVPRGRLDGLGLQASDAAWRHGSGPAVTGPLEALAMAVTGRTAALEDLAGPGRATLAGRI